MTLDATGMPVINVALCPDARLVSVDLIDAASLSEDGSTPLRYLWKVRSTQDSRGGRYSFPISEDAPDGFVLEVPLIVELQTVASLAVGVDTQGRHGGAGWVFRMDQLRHGEVLTVDDSLVSPADFSDDAAKSC